MSEYIGRYLAKNGESQIIVIKIKQNHFYLEINVKNCQKLNKICLKLISIKVIKFYLNYTFLEPRNGWPVWNF